MPELPEVQTVLDGFVKAIGGTSIEGLECYYPGTVIFDADLPDTAFPAKMTTHKRLGKYMHVHLDSGCSLIIHLRMTGKLVFAPNAEEPLPHERARFTLAGGEVVHFIDPRTFGKIILCKTDNLHSYMPVLGMEPLDSCFTPANLLDAIKGKKAPIKTVLLDQKIVAGLGNIYVCEVLYRAGIMPSTPAGKLKSEAVARIVKETVAVLSAAIEMGGTSISDFRRIDDKSGEFQHFLQVYQKEQCPKGHNVERSVIAGRGTFFCPVCQK
ncbi:MAG: bifunctional DNA-formamidopyrimidine glycosylase/DNA-(apurinic or apyrimidinic site) lyase [Candidatus Cloacimonetes bacterium HGW-Cloacimonetes-3]|jgi:formamidopyrimidine-DNA glycosylase|nr:MAG: bifunctional DNA-formamidopyrimidine glycosylase/DNA-(apurinic or apyrimidinic site) lyase [Candidatus Cloacimonetes bacterium HGW-Cloacimonetes-3]